MFKKYALNLDSIPPLLDYLTAVPPHLCNMQGPNDSGRHGHFREKKKAPTTDLNIFLSKFVFRRKMIILSFNFRVS